MFLVHGDAWGFESAFAGRLGGASRAPNLASWLAGRGVDVWGIDLRWISVPADTSNRAFMRSWGPEVDLRDIQLATSIERAVRGLTGSGFGRTALLGWSRGGFLAYAYANYESHLPTWSRNVNALIPADTVLRYSPKYNQIRQLMCSLYHDAKHDFAQGIYARDNRVLAVLGRLARAHPNDPSTLIPGVTNRQAVLLIGAQPGSSFSPWYHFVAGIFNTDGIPDQLRYTPARRFIRFFEQAASWEAQGEYVRSYHVWCGKPDPLVDNLHAINLPVLYLAAAGGFGVTGSYSTHLLGSHDTASIVVRLQPPGQEGDDFGHADLWQAANAPRLAWTPLLHWLQAHR